MSLLLDALQRASRDKEKAASGKAAADGEIRLRGSKPGDPAFPDLAPVAPPASLPPEPALELIHDAAPNVPHQNPDATPVPPEVAPDWEMLDAAAQGSSEPGLESSAPPPQPPVQQAEAPVLRSPSQVQVAQDIRRAYGQDGARPTKGRRRILILGSVVVVLMLGLGALFWLGLDESGVRVTTPAPAPADAPTAAAEPAVAPPASAAPALIPQAPPVTSAGPATTVAKPVAQVNAPTPSAAAATARTSPSLSANAVTGAAVAPTNAARTQSLPGHALGLRGAVPQPEVESRMRGPSALEAGYSALLEGKLDEAARLYAQALSSNPQERDALLGLGYIAHQKGLRDEAQGYYRRVLRQDPGNAIANAALLALDAEVNANSSSRQARELAARQPDSALALSTAGNALVREGSLADAAQYFERAQKLEPGNALHAYNHAVALDRLGQSAAAAVQYQRVLALAETTPPYAASAVALDAVRQRLDQLRQALNLRTQATP